MDARGGAKRVGYELDRAHFNDKVCSDAYIPVQRIRLLDNSRLRKQTLYYERQKEILPLGHVENQSNQARIKEAMKVSSEFQLEMYNDHSLTNSVAPLNIMEVKSQDNKISSRKCIHFKF